MQSKHWPPSDSPPSYDGSREAGAFDDYKIKAKLWLKTSNLNDNMKGVRLLQGLTGRAFEQMESLTEDETWLDSEDGGQQLIALMSSEWLFGRLSNKDLAQELQEICYDCMKYEDGGLADFHSRLHEQARRLKRAKVESSSLRMLLLRKDGTSGNGAATSTGLAESPEGPESSFAEDTRSSYDEEREIPENDPVRTGSQQCRYHWRCAAKIYDEEGHLSVCLGRCILAKGHAGDCRCGRCARNRRHADSESGSDDADKWTEDQVVDLATEE